MNSPVRQLPVDHAAPLVMAVNTGQPVDSQWETSMKLDERSEDIPQVPTLWIPQPIGSPRVSSSLERPISSLDYTQNYQANIFNRVLQDLYTSLASFPTFNGWRGMAISLDSTLRSHRLRLQNCKIARLQGNTSLMLSGCGTDPGRCLP